MTQTDYKCMKLILEKQPCMVFRIPGNKPGFCTEVHKDGREYAVYSCWPNGRDCIATSYSLDKLKYLFVD